MTCRGAVVGPFEELNEHMPEFYGGGIVRIVGDNWATYKDAPDIYEAGSPNYPGVVGLGKAIEILEEVGFDDIQAHEQVLIRKLVDGLKGIEGIVIYGDTDDLSGRVGVVTFNFADVNSFYLARRLSEEDAIATRRGAFCAHPYVCRLMGIPDEDLESFIECTDANTPGMIRVSFGIYNTEAEVEEFLKILKKKSEEGRVEMLTSAYEPEY